MIEHWKENLNKDGVLLMYLSKDFDTLDHSLFLAKLHAYGFDSPSLKFMKHRLSNKYQLCKIHDVFNNLQKIKSDVP